MSHVSNLTGGDWADIFLLSFIPYVSMFGYILYLSRLSSFSKWIGKEWVRWIWECVCVSFPLVSLLTLFSSERTIFSVVFTCILTNVLFTLTSSHTKENENIKTKKEKEKEKEEGEGKGEGEEREIHLTYFNVAMMLVTVVAILAVDFHVFPRRFAKRETFGFSLMDLGVGAFVFKSGFLSRISRESSTRQTCHLRHGIERERRGGKGGERMNVFLRSLRSSSPLFFLGALRLFLVKSSNYQEHVSEYGVHWNFFFTLFAVRIFTSLLSSLVPSLSPRSYFAFGVTLISVYQVCLSNGVTNFLESEERETLFEMNKEGIVSLIGYFSLYCSSIFFGNLYFQRKTLLSHTRTILYWATLTLFFWMTSYLSHSLIQMASRRFVNVTYFLLIHAFFSTSLFACYLLQTSCSFLSFPKENIFLDMVNRSALLVFLVGNLLTGGVNFAVNTLEMSDLEAFWIVMGYVVLTCFLGSLLSSLSSSLFL